MSRRDEFGFGLQGNIDTEAPSMSFSPPITGSEMAMDRQDMEIEETMGNRAPSAQDYGGKVFSGPVEAAARPTHLGGIFSMFWGPPITSTQPDAMASPNVWTHEWDPLVADPVFATFLTKANDPDPSIINKFIGALGSELTLEVETNNYLLYTAEAIARQIIMDPAAPAALTRETLPKWPFTDVQVLLGVAGSVPEIIKSKMWNIEFNNNLVDDEYILGQDMVDSIPLGDIELMSSFQPTRDISAHNRRAMADRPDLVKIVLRAVGRTIGASTERYTLEIELAACETIEAEVALDGSETLTDTEVSVRCILDESTNSLLKARLTNGHDGSLYLPPAVV